ncbi:CAAX protease self-immunity [Spirosomataceae bacterium TFI 002]|nr:CAAX protease self-immunity [Spirosomataceae bacterium TFI 002]
MKIKVFKFLTKPYTVVLTMLITPLFGFIDRNLVFFSALGVAFLILWGSNYNWKRFGFGEKLTLKTVITSIGMSFIIFIVFSLFIDPLLIKYLGEFNLSSLNDIRGNLSGYIVIMIIMWLFAAFGEEFLFRGYYMKSLAQLIGNKDISWLLSALITSAYFGISHLYQGASGIVSVGLWSLVVSLIFYKRRNNLLLLVLIHGISDSVGLTLLYLNKDHLLTDWAQRLF